MKYVIIDEGHLIVTRGSTFCLTYANFCTLWPVLEQAYSDYYILFEVFTATVNIGKLHNICNALGIKNNNRIYILLSTNQYNLFYRVVP